MGIVFEGDPPYDLPVAQAAEATAEGDTVLLTVRVSIPGKLPKPAPIYVQLPLSIAEELAAQIQPAVAAARARKRSSAR